MPRTTPVEHCLHSQNWSLCTTAFLAIGCNVCIIPFWVQVNISPIREKPVWKTGEGESGSTVNKISKWEGRSDILKSLLIFLCCYHVLLQTSEDWNGCPFLYSKYFRFESETDFYWCLILNTKWDYTCTWSSLCKDHSRLWSFMQHYCNLLQSSVYDWSSSEGISMWWTHVQDLNPSPASLINLSLTRKH